MRVAIFVDHRVSLTSKDLVITFAKEKPQLSPLFIQNYELAPVKSAKVLGIHLSADIKWNLHIAHIWFYIYILGSLG